MRQQGERGRRKILPAARALLVGEWCKARERVQGSENCGAAARRERLTERGGALLEAR